MANDKRLIDAIEHHSRVSEVRMTDLFPDWREFPQDVQEKLTKLGKKHEQLLFEAPTVDAVEVVHGRWQWKSPNGWACSECGEWGLMIDNRGICKSSYCPNCGAKMDGGNHDGK